MRTIDLPSKMAYAISLFRAPMKAPPLRILLRTAGNGIDTDVLDALTRSKYLGQKLFCTTRYDFA